MAPCGTKRRDALESIDRSQTPNTRSFMKFSWKPFVLLAAALAVAGPGQAADGPAIEENPVLVRMAGGETIAESDLTAYLQRRVDLRSAIRNVWGIQTALKEMAMTRSLVLEGGVLGVERAAGKEKTVERFDDAYAYAVFKKIAPQCEPPADAAAARKFFDETPEAFRVPPMARLSRIMLPTGATVEGEAAAGWLLQQTQAIGSGARKFDAAAEIASGVYKLDPQGDLGWVTLTNDVPILRALADAKTGDMVGPVPEGEFVYLFQIVSKRDARQLTWDEAATSAPARAVRYCREQATAKTEEKLFKKYDVQIDVPKIRTLFNTSRKKPQAVTQ